MLHAGLICEQKNEIIQQKQHQFCIYYRCVDLSLRQQIHDYDLGV